MIDVDAHDGTIEPERLLADPSFNVMEHLQEMVNESPGDEMAIRQMTITVIYQAYIYIT